jgi:hypothetical protein
MSDDPNAQPPQRPNRRWLDDLLARLVKLIQPVMNTLRVLWLTGWCVALFALGAVFFLLNDQGVDFLRRLVEARGWYAVSTNLFCFVGVVAWGLSTWYCARLLLTRQFPRTDPKFFDQTTALRTWLPRVGGGLVSLIVAAGLVRMALHRGAGTLGYVLVFLYVALGVGLFVLVWKRRVMFSRLVTTRADEPVQSLPAGSWRALQVSFAVSLGLLALFLLFPVSVATALGMPAILLMAVASWILFGSMVITYWPLANGFTSLTLPLILAALLMSWLNDNHTIRSTTQQVAAAPREKPEAHFRNWLNPRLERAPPDRPYHVFVVASAGGGIRAAYWTATVLGRIGDRGDGRWPDHLYAMSGVSGGSVGSALHAAQIADLVAAPATAAGGAPAGLEKAARGSLDNDILSPVIAYLLFPDLMQRFLPVPLSFADRARAIELAMEAAAADRRGANGDRFARRFVELWPANAPYRVPVLLLNTTVVETGQRAIVSNLEIDKSFSDTLDPLGGDASASNMPLSTAAHLSARFSYVSPAGTIRKKDGTLWGHIVDGGYFENSGAASAVELMERMRAVADSLEDDWSKQHKPHKVALNLILIRNDPDAPSVCSVPAGDLPPPKHPYSNLNDLLSPVRALLSTRQARGRLAEHSALAMARGFHPQTGSIQSPGCESGCVFEFSLGDGNIEPPLGWSLSEKARADMQRHLDKQQDKLDCIAGMLAGTGCAKEPPCAGR